MNGLSNKYNNKKVFNFILIIAYFKNQFSSIIKKTIWFWKNDIFIFFSKKEKIFTPTEGLEPSTTRLRALRSTNWAKRVCYFLSNIIE